MDMGTKRIRIRRRSSKVVLAFRTSPAAVSISISIFHRNGGALTRKKKHWGICFLINEEIWGGSGAKN
jgi:hypothetical protein